MDTVLILTFTVWLYLCSFIFCSMPENCETEVETSCTSTYAIHTTAVHSRHKSSCISGTACTE